MEDTTKIEIDLLGLFRHLKRKFWIVLISCVVCGILGFFTSRFIIPQQYTATTRVYVLNRSGDGGMVSSDFTLSNYMISDYRILIVGQNVTDDVVTLLNLDMTHEELTEKIDVSAENNTRVLQISVTDTDPMRAAAIANCVREVASVQIKEIMAVDAVNLIYAAKIPTDTSSPDIVKNTGLAAAAGTVISIGILSAIFLLNDSISTEEEVERYLGLNTMGVIPYSDGLGENRSSGGLYEAGIIRKYKKKGASIWKKSM